MKKQVPQVSFKIVVGDSMLVFSHEFLDISFCESLDILDNISYYGAQAFSLYTPRASLASYLIACSSPHRISKDGDIMHSLGHLLLTHIADFTSYGSMIKGETYNLLGITSHGFNYQALLLSHHFIL